jgi:Lipopolysaccharide-assembly
MISNAKFFGTICLLFIGLGCGYSFQNSKNDLYDKEGVQKIYVSPLTNNSYKPGVENLVYNNLIRTLAAHGKVTLVQNPEDADAILSGTVVTASYMGSGAETTVSQLNPQGVGSTLPTSNFVIATEYTANLVCSFSLVRRSFKVGKRGQIWSSQFNRSKPFPASNQLDVLGTTSSLINDSEFDRVLADLARNITDDAHDAMLARF